MTARVVITGLGIACPLGVGHDALAARLAAGETAVCDRPPSREGLLVAPATAFATEFEAERHVDPRKVRKSSGASRLAAVAATLAVEDAGLPAGPRSDAGVSLGTCFGAANYYLEFEEELVRSGVEAANAVLFTEGVYNAPPGLVSQLLGLRGPSVMSVGGEAVGLSAIALGVDKVALGDAAAFVAGGVEEYCDRVQASLLSEGRVGRRLEPDDAPERSLLAEGAATVVLEPLEQAQARGATIYAEVRAAARARAGRRGPGDAPLVRAVRSVLAQAGVALSELDLVVGGGGGGPLAADERAALAALGHVGPRWDPKASLGEGFAFTSAARAVLGARACGQNGVNRVLVLGVSEPGGSVALLLDRIG